MKIIACYALLIIGLPIIIGQTFAVVSALAFGPVIREMGSSDKVLLTLFLNGLFGGFGGLVCSYWMFRLFGLNQSWIIPVWLTVFYSFYKVNFRRGISGLEIMGQLAGCWGAWIFFKL